MSIPVIVIAGPTGIGKTRAAIDIARRLNGEIVNADSMQIYRYMDIGTAKPTSEERALARHYLLDIRDPDQEYSVAEYVHDATAVIHEIAARGKMPLLVGGTGLYIEKALYGIFDGPGRHDDFREQMRTLAEKQGAQAVHERLRQVDPVSARRLHPNDLARVIRALEVFFLTGKPMSAHQAEATIPAAQYRACFLALNTDREALYERINRRVDQMVADGLVDEVRELYQRGYHRELHALKSLGYKEIGDVLAGIRDLSAAKELIKQNTRRYAKRQLTWFRKYADAHWIHRDMSAPLEHCVQTCLQRIADCRGEHAQ